MAMVALWYLGVTAALAAVLGLVVALQSLSALVRRRRRASHRVVTVPAQRGAGRRTGPESRSVRADGPLPVDLPSAPTLASSSR